jgi:hypothetical protein
MKNRMLLHPPKVVTRKEINLGNVGLILRDLTKQIKNAAVRFQYCLDV